jgi:hypothetical protein
MSTDAETKAGRDGKGRIQTLLAEYGPVALWVYFGIFGLVLAAFAMAISFGIRVESATEGAGTLGAAYLATKVTQPLRIAATLVVTPLVAGVMRRLRA